jgi:hypothetical protein
VGCVSQPFPHDQLVYFSLSSVNGSGVSVIPKNYWKMMYTVQIVENGEFKEQYYGGHDGSLLFLYSHADESYELSNEENLWDYPDNCETECVRTFDNSTEFIPYQSYMSTLRTGGASIRVL